MDTKEANQVTQRSANAIEWDIALSKGRIGQTEKDIEELKTKAWSGGKIKQLESDLAGYKKDLEKYEGERK
ncbi:unnamed protein product [Clonostachys rosea]|uniref:Uncharacterized protein n=1 Tax=Bionectria ochroleuca TaxID=29856 RepID=A0ABY6UEK5_BIOOC|nr:unnamed protein product [Clonostachys rosea]